MHLKIDSLAYSNRLRHLPPTHKVIFTIMLFILGYLSFWEVQLIISIWMLIWVIVYAGIPKQVYGQLLVIPVSFWLMSVPAIALGIVSQQNLGDVSGDIYQGINIGNWYLYLSKQGIIQIQILLTRALALTSVLYFLLLTTPFGEILTVLARLGIPSLILELLTLMYRAIFILTQTASELIVAQKSRLGYVTWRRSMDSLAILVTQLLKRSLENYRQLTLGLKSRGFIDKISFWYPTQYQANPRYTVEALGGYFVLVTYTIWDYVNRV